MGRSPGVRTLVVVSVALAVLLAALAVVQYRWSVRVSAADEQREKEHLSSAAALFATEFNALAGEAVGFLQNDAAAALRNKQALGKPPKLISEIYAMETGPEGPREVERLGVDGRFAAASLPSWAAKVTCESFVLSSPPAIVAPLFEVAIATKETGAAMRMVRTIQRQPGRCFVARLDEGYLRQTLIPRLIRESFGPTAASEYDFAVVSREAGHTAEYGKPARADLREPFFAPVPLRLKQRLPEPPEGIRHFDAVYFAKGTGASLIEGGAWELQVSRKGQPLETAFEARRRRDLLFSAAVEATLIAAIAFLVVGARRAERVAGQKMRFVAGVSHELRTPVSAIAMLARNQADGLVTDAEKVRQYGELMHRESQRLNEMVEQTLEYAGIHSGVRKRAAHTVDLGALIERAIAARRDDLERKGFQVELAVDAELPAISGDGKLLETAVDNLLRNAERHAGGGHWIRVSASYSAAEKEVRIAVEDRGPGIDAAMQEAIFEPFYRGPAAIEAQIPGSGLGLSLVRDAASAHHGSVTLASAPGRGSTFTLHLPV
jgi:two-component system sensor histidine kinase SenX3